MLKRFLDTDIKEIRVFSRDVKKQEDMRIALKNPKLKFYIGDVREYNSVANAIQGVDYIFHAAALKQVPSCEFYPMEAIRTKVLGTEAQIRSKENLIKKVMAYNDSIAPSLATDYHTSSNGYTGHLISQMKPHEAMVDAYRTLRTNLQFIGVDLRINTL